MYKETFSKAREFIFRNARPLDLARWQYHFENGSKESVLRALEFYQNNDGGFGHALEADSWNPNSNPAQTCGATEILHEIKYNDQSHKIMQGILRYLDSGKDFNGKFWLTTVMSNNDYPHAPWWHTNSESASHTDYNPTATLVGFILKYSEKSSHLYEKAVRITREAINSYLKANKLKDMHTGCGFVRLIEYCDEADIDNLFDMPAAKLKLREFVRKTITQERVKWNTEYVCKPSFFLTSHDSIFYEDNKNISEFECEFIVRTQLDDGSWNIPWGWNDYPEEWAISKNWWKSNGIILNMLYLKGFNKLD